MLSLLCPFFLANLRILRDEQKSTTLCDFTFFWNCEKQFDHVVDILHTEVPLGYEIESVQITPLWGNCGAITTIYKEIED